MKTLTIRLSGPLQSYGDEATFDRRTTYTAPSKSALIGMISAALGYSRNDQRIKELSSKLQFASRIDQPGRQLTDFHMAHKQKSSWLTYRDYLSDAVYMVAIGGEDDLLIDKINFALHHPKYQLYLGRKSNPPAGVLKIEEFKNQNPNEVLHNLPWQASDWYKRKKKSNQQVKVELYSDADLNMTSRTFLIKDKVKSFDQKNRQYGYRSVVKEWVTLKNDFYQSETTHDVMNFL